MSDEQQRDCDERFYEQTAYNESYYLEREQELIRESNLELDLEDLEGGRTQDTSGEEWTSQPSSPKYSPGIDYSLEVF
jgi:hypothetical protein